MSAKTKSHPKYLHQIMEKKYDGDYVNQKEEFVSEGDKGIRIKFYSNTKKGTKRILLFSNNDGTFMMITQDGDKKAEKTLSKEEFIKEVKSNKNLSFASDFIATFKGGHWWNGGAKRGSKRGSKRSSRRGSRKSSRKN